MTSRILAIANQKGGVGKTTTTLGLAAAIAHTGRRVLVIDMDPQANASSTLLPDYDERLRRSKDSAEPDYVFYTTNDILENGVEPADIFEAIVETPWDRVDLIPSQQSLANRDTEGAIGVETRLRRILMGLDLAEDPYDAVLLDCPPSVGKLTVNALVAASEILLISGPDRYGHNALNQIEETLKTVRDSYLHTIEVAGLVINMYENTNEANLRTDQLKERFGDKVLLVMPKRTVLSHAAGSNQSVFTVARRDAQEVAGWFTDLARELRLIAKREVVPDLPQIDEANETAHETVAPLMARVGS